VFSTAHIPLAEVGKEWQLSHFKITECDARHCDHQTKMARSAPGSTPADVWRHGCNGAVAGRMTPSTPDLRCLVDIVAPGGAAIYNAPPASNGQ
jgi:hypothetical protein